MIHRAARLLLLAAVCAGCARGPDGPPPVILICVDTLRADRLPSYGYRKVETPALDRLARDSVVFENAYSHVPLTLPSHASLFTGRLPFEHGIRDNLGYALAPGTDTIATALSARGYAAGGAVSAAVLARASGIARGFSFWDDAVNSESGAERDGEATAAALSRWAASRRGPFLAFLHLFEPHAPYQAPEPHRSRWSDAYDAEIARADQIVGSFLAAMRSSGVYDRSLIVFLSDHGEGLGDHGELEHGILLYREALRVPLFVKFPFSANGGKRVRAPAALIDVFPTIARALRVDPPANLRGVALQELVSKGAAPDRRIYGETFYPRLRLGWSDLATLIDDRWQYIEAPRPELYDVVSDPAEIRDLSEALSPAFRSMRLELARMERSFELPRDADPDRARRLAALGYLTVRSPASSEQDLPDPKDRIRDSLAQPAVFQRLAQKSDAEIVVAARRFLEASPAALDVSRLLADALERSGRRGEAIDALERGLRESATTAAPALRDMAVERLAELLVLSGRRKEAFEIAADPAFFQDARSAHAVGVAHAEAGNLQPARAFLERAVRIDPNGVASRVALGSVLLRQRALSQALAELKNAVELDSRFARGWEALGQAYALSGNETKAVACWEQALQLDRRRYPALYNLAIAAGRSGDVARARALLKRLLLEAPPSEYPEELAEARRLVAGGG